MTSITARATANSPRPHIAHLPFKVLILDDEPDIVNELTELLSDEGYECLKTSDPQEAADLVEHMHDIGILITDVRMPGMDGLDLIRQMKLRLPAERDLHAIVITGHADLEEAITALKLGAGDFLTKPIEMDHLLMAVKKAEDILRLRQRDRMFQESMAHEVRVKTAETRALSEALLARNQELESVNRELTSLSRLKSEFLNMLSHEMNTPLNAIIGFAELMKMNFSAAGDHQNSERAEQILISGNRLHRNVNRILDMAELRGGKGVLRSHPTSTANIAEDLRKEYADFAANRRIGLKIEAPDPALELVLDQSRMVQLLGELISNSVHFSPPNTSVLVQMSGRGDNLTITVSDQGPGMSKEDMAASLDLLRQVDGSMARVNEGMGLGLPLAKELTELHGGSLSIHSSSEDGTTVSVSVPRHATGPGMI